MNYRLYEQNHKSEKVYTKYCSKNNAEWGQYFNCFIPDKKLQSTAKKLQKLYEEESMKLKIKTKMLPVLVLCAVVLGTVLPASAFVQAEPYDIYKNVILYDSYNQAQENSYSQILEDTQNHKHGPEEIIVKFEPGVSEEKIASINSRHGTKEIYTSSRARFKLLKIPKSKTVEEMVKIYSKNPNVEYALPNAITHAATVPNDQLYGYQWNFKDGIGGINVEPAWDVSTGQGVVVAVLDTGVAYENYGTYTIAPDLSNTNFVPGYDFVNNDAHPNDDHYHGTHVAGTVAQNTNDGYGVAGVAYGCSIMPVKVMDGNGNGTLQQLIDGIYFATDNGADIISMSLSFDPGYYPGQALDDALEYAYNNGVTTIAAAGNEQTGTVSYPAAYHRCIAVGATNYNGVLADYSNYGTDIDIVAPGGDSQDLNGDGYMDGILQNTFNPQTKDPTDFNWWFLTGTSMATPHVSGTAALMLAANSEATPDDIMDALENTAKDMGSQGWDQYYGHGIINATAALEYITQPPAPNTPPVADAGGPYNGEADQLITFNGAGSYDTDGYIISYEWNFGDGSTGLGVAPEHAYSNAGVYNVTLTIWDNKNATGTDTAAVEINEVPPPVNNPPVANAGGPYSAEEEQDITFDGSGSYDPDQDGYISRYEWDFGDGSTGSGVSPVHAYSTAGTYNVTLTVWDDKNATGTDTSTAEITEASQENLVHIASVEVNTASRKAGKNIFVSATAFVTVLDSSNAPVDGATVTGYWSDATSDTDSAVTDSTGTVTVYSDEVKYKKGTLTFTFTVNGVSHTIPWDGNTASGTAVYP